MARRPRRGDDNPPALSEDEAIIQEAKDRFKLAMDYETDFRKLYIEDVKFANGDSDNGWQWPSELKEDREKNRRPSLTINKTQTHVLLLVNQGRQNKPAIKAKPIGEVASYKAAQVWQDLFRHIEYVSKAQSIYDDAQQSQVEGGVGYWRIISDYVDETSFDQDLFIAPVQDHLSVLLDNAIKQKDGSDANWGFIYEDLNRKEFERLNPGIELPDKQSISKFDLEEGWITPDEVRICEYYRLVPKKDELIFIELPGGDSATFLRSEVPPQLKDALEQAENEKSAKLKTRPVIRKELEWYKLCAAEIMDRRQLKGRYVPIVRAIGRERRIEGKLERKGLVRTLKDPQRMYNYNTSGEVEVVALQTKTPYKAAAAAIEGNEEDWFNANTQNKAVLTWRHKDEDGGDIPEPRREEAPTPSQAFIEGMRIAAAEMEMASGQYGPQMQNPNLERTPKAVGERVKISDTVNFDFIDNLGLAVAHTARIILDMAPYYYDTERVVQIMGHDGTLSTIQLNPSLDEPYQETKEGDEVKIALNPKIGRYLVQADIGPAYVTQREEAWNALLQIVAGSPESLNDFGDLMFSAADFPMADKIAERIRRKIKQIAPWMLDDETMGPLVQQLQQQIQQLQGDLATSMQKLAEKELALKGKEERSDIEVFRAQTERIGKLDDVVADFAELGLDPEKLKMLVRKTIAEMMGFDLGDVIQANKPALDAQETPKAGGSNGT